MTLLEELKRIRDDGPGNRRWGICANLGREAKILEFRELAANWPKYSGSNTFPVPCPGYDSGTAYVELTKWEGEYGALRMELVNWCIGQLESRNEN